MAKSSPRLGRGLDALLSHRKTAERSKVSAAAPIESSSDVASGTSLAELPLDSIRPNVGQPRKLFSREKIEQLSASIQSCGLIQPIVVRRLDADTYELVAGERRWRAAREAGLERVPAIVRDVSDAESIEIALVENLQREDLSPIERGTAYQQYLEVFGATADELASRLGESRASISNYIRLLRLPVEIRDMLAAGELGMGQARAIAGISDPQRQLAVARLAVRRNLSVRQVEELAKPVSRETLERNAASGHQLHTEDLARTFSKSLGVSVRIAAGKRKNSGKIIIQYRDLDEFDRISERLGVDSSDH